MPKTETVVVTENEKRLIVDVIGLLQSEVDKLIKKEQDLKEFEAAQKSIQSRKTLEAIKSKFL